MYHVLRVSFCVHQWSLHRCIYSFFFFPSEVVLIFICLYNCFSEIPCDSLRQLNLNDLHWNRLKQLQIILYVPFFWRKITGLMSGKLHLFLLRIRVKHRLREPLLISCIPCPGGQWLILIPICILVFIVPELMLCMKFEPGRVAVTTHEFSWSLCFKYFEYNNSDKAGVYIHTLSLCYSNKKFCVGFKCICIVGM